MVQSYKILYWAITLSHPDHCKPDGAADYYPWQITLRNPEDKLILLLARNVHYAREWLNDLDYQKLQIQLTLIHSANQCIVDLYVFTTSGLQGWLI